MKRIIWIGLLFVPILLQAAVDPLFERYVAIGDSITHGFQGGAVDESRQQAIYPVLLAELMQTEFNVPKVKFPGYLVNLEDVGKGTIQWWQYYYVLVGGVRTDRYQQQSTLNNFAITGSDISTIQEKPAKSEDVFDYLGNRLFHLVLGEQGESAVEQALARNPTFLTLWVGNNDVLSTALWTDPAKMTPVDVFTAQMNQLVARIKQTPTLKGVAIATVPDVASIAYLQETNDPDVPPRSLAAFWNVDISTEGDVLDPNEIVLIRERAKTINEVIRNVATTNGWALFDAERVFNEVIEQGYILHDAQGNPTNRVISSEYLGALFSLDGVHPSITGHAVIANYFSKAINQTYGTQLGLIDEYAASEKDSLYGEPYDPRGFIHSWEWHVIQFVLSLFM